jgi:hypothetical protein
LIPTAHLVYAQKRKSLNYSPLDQPESIACVFAEAWTPLGGLGGCSSVSVPSPQMIIVPADRGCA